MRSRLAALLTSIFNDVCTSQAAPVSKLDHTVTVYFNDNNSGHDFTLRNRQFQVKTGNELVLSLNNNKRNDTIIPEGYTFNSVTNVTVAKTGLPAVGNGCYYVSDDTINYGLADGTLTLRGIKADIAVNVSITATDYAISGTWADGTILVSAPCYTTSGGTTYKNVASDNPVAHAGDKVIVQLNQTGAYNGLSVYSLEVVKNGTTEKIDVIGGGATGRFEFIMPNAPVTLTAKYAAQDFKVNFVGENAVTLTAGDATPNTSYSFNAVVKAGYELKGITYAGGGKSGNLNGQTGPTYTISADAVAKGLTVTFDAKLKEFDVTLKGGAGMAPEIVELGSTQAPRTYAKQTIESAITFNVNVKSDVLVVTAPAGASIHFAETSGNTTRVTVTGMTVGGDIVVSRNP